MEKMSTAVGPKRKEIVDSHPLISSPPMPFQPVSNYAATVDSRPRSAASPWHSERLPSLFADHHPRQFACGHRRSQAAKGCRSPLYNELCALAARGYHPICSCHPLCIWAVGRKRPPLCRGCAPATPPSKTIPHPPCAFNAACRLASNAAAVHQLRRHLPHKFQRRPACQEWWLSNCASKNNCQRAARRLSSASQDATQRRLEARRTSTMRHP